MLIEHLLDVGEAHAQADMGELSDFYRAARAKFDGDPAFADRARAARRAAAGRRRAHARRCGGSSSSSSKRYFSAVYERLGVALRDEHVRGESAYNADARRRRCRARAQGARDRSTTARCASFPPGFTNRDGEPLPLIVRKQDGGYGYAATDLAALRYRTQRARRRRGCCTSSARRRRSTSRWCSPSARTPAGSTPPARAEHVAFGSVLGADKKMFKTPRRRHRALADLLDEAVERAAAELRRREAPTATRRARRVLAAAIGIGAVKYADLSNDRIKDYVFDWDRMLASEGQHGAVPAVRARAHPLDLPPRGGAGRRAHGTAPFSLREPAERKLALELLDFGNAVIEAGETLEPHRLCGYLYDLATAFTAFFETCPVLKAPDDATRASRLALCELTARVLSCGLGCSASPRPSACSARAH